MSIAGYRRLLRSIKVTFRGDDFALKMARSNLRSQFLENKNVSEVTRLKELFQDIEDIDDMLRFHIVQGKRNDKGNFEVKLRAEHQETIAAGQSLPHGPELETIDPSYVGRSVIINKTKGDRKPFNPDA